MIVKSTGLRELITLDGNGIELQGTYHKPSDGETRAGSPTDKNCTGIVFVNALSTPRTATGDSAVYWASSYAALGYPSFRFDLPGLGDSWGEIPNDLHSFINGGGYASVLSQKIGELVERFCLPRVLLFGHCAGATNAIYAASECAECKGLILLDPYFNLPKAITATLRPEFVHWARKSKIGEVLRASYDRLREIPIALRKNPLPQNANFGLISRWKKLASKGIPILVLRAPQPKALGSGKLRSGTFDYLQHIHSLTRGTNQLTVMEIESTDHSFANPVGRATVRKYSETWLGEHFPQVAIGIAPSHDHAGKKRDRLSLSVSMPAQVHASRID
jgi:pimeloyl-ACP methyl ester carboxylesterase